MAAKTLKRGEAIVWLPARSGGEARLREEPSLVALIGGAAQVQPRRVSLDALDGIRSIGLVLDPRDCTVLKVTLPPLAGARLMQALPNVVEEHLLQDPAECLLALGPPSAPGEPRLIAAADREWVELVLATFENKGHRITGLWPASEALPRAPRHATLGCVNEGIVLRVGELDAIGGAAPQETAERIEALRGMLQVAGLSDPQPGAEKVVLTAWVDQPDWAEAIGQAARTLGLSAETLALEPGGEPRLDLLEARPARARRMIAGLDPAAFRLPMVLAGACLAAALLGLNLHWWQLIKERDAARAALEAAFRAAVPSAQVVVDPLLQMTRHVAMLSASAGQTNAQDVLPLLGRLAQALGPQAVDALASVEYSEGRLKIRFRPERVDSRSAREQLQNACARAGLQLRFDNDRDPAATLALGG